MLRKTVDGTTLSLIRGDITLLDVDAIVNAANADLRGGGGVDGAIHRAGGAQILEECRRIIASRGPLPTGGAVITSGGRLKARHVIHAVGPVWEGGGAGEERLLADAYRNSLALARIHGLRTIAFPSISTGVYGFPIEQASRIAMDTIREDIAAGPWFTVVTFVTFNVHDYDVYEALFASLH